VVLQRKSDAGEQPGGPVYRRQNGVMTPRRLAPFAGVLLLAGCSLIPTAPDADIRLPPASAGFDYQLGGGYELPAGVTVVARDSTDEPADGAYNICYVNGFQTQPGEGARWLADHPDLVLRDASGDPFVDPGWPDEYLLDTSSAANRDRIAALLHGVLAVCRASGFDAVEIDNLDSYSRSDGALTFDDNVALATSYARMAHDLGLAIAQKNGAGSSEQLRDAVGFDFAVTEECARYDECSDYVAAYGDLVFDIEYSAEYLEAACAAVGSAILRDLDLTAPGDPSYVFSTC
jgi:hypothetical protein